MNDSVDVREFDQVTVRYFYADGPSPLHEAFQQMFADRRAAIENAQALAKRVGAESIAMRSRIEGFIFDAPPGLGWIVGGTDDKRRTYYRPRKNSKAGKAIAAEMAAIRFPQTDDILAGLDLSWLAYSPRESCMYRTTLGFKDDRALLQVPFGGEGNGEHQPPVPPYVTEWKEWEFQRWMAEGRPQ